MHVEEKGKKAKHGSLNLVDVEVSAGITIAGFAIPATLHLVELSPHIRKI